jgi:hypothetical protein
LEELTFCELLNDSMVASLIALAVFEGEDKQTELAASAHRILDKGPVTEVQETQEKAA